MHKKKHTWDPLGAPPNMHVFLIEHDAPKSFATDWICCANSLVGARTSAIGPSPFDNGFWLVMCTVAGRAYCKHFYLCISVHIFLKKKYIMLKKIHTAKVFPDPVCAMPTISLPLRAIGHPCAWIAVGFKKL